MKLLNEQKHKAAEVNAANKASGLTLVSFYFETLYEYVCDFYEMLQYVEYTVNILEYIMSLRVRAHKICFWWSNLSKSIICVCFDSIRGLSCLA